MTLTDRFRAVADHLIETTGCTVGWTDTRDATSQVSTQHVTAPRLDGPDPVFSMTALLHELGHLQTAASAPLGKWRGETAASLWALNQWQLNELPYYDRAERRMGEALGGYLREAIDEGKATLAEIRERVPDELLSWVGPLHEPEYLCEMTETQIRVALKAENVAMFPVEASLSERLRMVKRLNEWD